MWLSAVLVAVASVTPPHDPFACKMEITAEDGQVDPAIARRYSAAFAACQHHANITSANADCFVDEFARQNEALNRTWRATLTRLPAAERRPLLEAQREWVAARDPFCKDQSDGFSGGAIAPIIYLSCRVELTIRRSLWLEHLR